MINLGETSTLTWTSTHTSACTAAGAWTGSKSQSGTQTVHPSAVGSYTYTLSCSTASGSLSRSATLTVNERSGRNRSGLPWKSGASPGSGIGSIAIEKSAQFGAWRGRQVDIASIFIGKDSWTESYEAYLTNPVLQSTGAVAAYKNANIHILLTVPLVIAADRGRFQYVANGGIDSKHQAIANKIKTIVGTGPIYLRLGHEADEGYPWSYTGHGGSDPDPAIHTEYQDAWNRIAHIYKTTLPGAKMVWNVLKNTRQRVTDYYPGDVNVDIISIDVYDNGSGGYCDSETSAGWVNICRGSYDAATGVSNGIAGILAFAKLHHKKFGVDEWGATNKTLLPTDGANNSFFVQGMFEFFRANSAYLEDESYSNRAGGGKHQVWPKTTYNPLPSDSYRLKYHP